MPSDDDKRLRDDLLARLDGLPVRARSMFGGFGLYLEDAFFGIIFEGRVYFRTDEESRSDYLSRGMTALQPPDRPRGPRTVDRNFELPEEILADEAVLRAWALRAAAASRR